MVKQIINEQVDGGLALVTQAIIHQLVVDLKRISTSPINGSTSSVLFSRPIIYPVAYTRILKIKPIPLCSTFSNDATPILYSPVAKGDA